MREKLTFRDKFEYDFKRRDFEYVVHVRRTARQLLNLSLITKEQFGDRLAYGSLLVEEIRAASSPSDLEERMHNFIGILAYG